jgi:hypothetical protein
MKNIPALALLAGIAFIHFKDIPTKLAETPYMGWGYILLVAGCAAAGAWFLSNHTRAAYALGSLISFAAITGYVLTRSIGLPQATDDIGNWMELSGVFSLVVETAFIALSLWMFGQETQRNQAMISS